MAHHTQLEGHIQRSLAPQHPIHSAALRGPACISAVHEHPQMSGDTAGHHEVQLPENARLVLQMAPEADGSRCAPLLPTFRQAVCCHYRLLCSGRAWHCVLEHAYLKLSHRHVTLSNITSLPIRRSRQQGGNGGGGPSFGSPAVEGHSNSGSYVRDVRTAFSGVPRIRPQWQDRYMKILVVGESGKHQVCTRESWRRQGPKGVAKAPACAETGQLPCQNSFEICMDCVCTAKGRNGSFEMHAWRRNGQDDLHPEPICSLRSGPKPEGCRGAGAHQQEGE